MIHRIVEFALKQRLVILVDALQNLPIEAYPDVADTWVQIITQWPGHAGEEVERQITVPTERVMNGVPKQSAIRSTSIAGLSVVTLIFQDGTDSYFARQQVLERLGQIALPDGVTPGTMVSEHENVTVTLWLVQKPATYGFAVLPSVAVA